MPRKFLTNVDLAGNQILNSLAQSLASDVTPAVGNAGQFWFDSTNKLLKYSDGTTVIDPRNRANHSGTQTRATISDLSGAALSSFAVPTASVSWNNQGLTNLSNPSNPQDGATKSYVDSQVQSSAAGIVSKPSCRVVATTNVATLSGLLTIDGQTLVAGDRVLLVGQTTTTQNGPYVAASGAWARPSGGSGGISSNGELALGSFWYIEQGTTYSASQWRLSSPTSGTITPDTTAVTITQFGTATSFTGTAPIVVTGNTISINQGNGITTTSGNLTVDPVVVGRKVSGTIPTTTGGIYTVTAGTPATVAIAHSLNNATPLLVVRDSTGAEVGVDNTTSSGSTTTLTLTFPTTPTANQYTFTIIG